MTPLPGYKAIPDGWSQHHRDTAASTMKTPCAILRPSGPPPYPKPKDWSPEDVLHETVCRLQQMNRDAAPIPAEQPTQIRRYRISVPYDGLPPLRVGEGGDTVLVAGRRYLIMQQLHGSELWEWDLICEDNLTQNQEV